MDFPLDVTNITIETDRLLLRAFTEADLDDFFAYASTPGVLEPAGAPLHTSIERTRMVLQSFLETKDRFAIVHKVDTKVIGSFGLYNDWINREEAYQHLKAKNIGYVLSKDYWGQGLMLEAVDAVLAYGFTTLDMDAFSIEHFIENPQSGRVIEKCGFTFVKEGTYHAKQLDKHFKERRYIMTKQDWDAR
ncbi:MAG: GNAT family N-acetyltransferase [Defluviitaleaceae bacterium]|nr:GNAT family N-acetyltransferase [Defluviitaleaceae bacterium]